MHLPKVNKTINTRVMAAIFAFVILTAAGTLTIAYATNRNSEAVRIRNRYDDALTHLASTSIEHRMAGVYELGDIAHESDQDRDVALKVLTGNLRILAPSAGGAGRTPQPPPAVSAPLIRAIFDVIGSMNESGSCETAGPARLDLAGINLRNQNLTRTNLSWLELQASDLSQAVLRQSQLCEVDLTGANLSNADLMFANLSGATMSHASFSAANLVSADLTGGRMDFADLSFADLHGASLSRTTLLSSDLREADLRGTDLSHANLNRADLSEANLEGANLSGADLQGANLLNANLTGAVLTDAVLRGANLPDADLAGANLAGADLQDANLQGVYLENAQHLTMDQVNSAVRNEWTRLPPQFSGTAELEATPRATPVGPG